MNYLCALSIDLVQIPEIKNQIKFYPNTSIYKSGDTFRYVEYTYIKGKRNHFIVGIDNSDYLQKVLQLAKNGALRKELIAILIDDEISFIEAEEFVDELIDCQVLVSELEPSVTGDEFLNQMITTLQSFVGIESILKLLLEIKEDIQNISMQAVGISVQNYDKIITKLSEINTKFDIKYLFQTDLVNSFSSLQINKNVSDEILKAIEVLSRLTPFQTNENLNRFKEEFYERYEEREVSLSQVLDVESGIGYLQTNNGEDISPLIDDLLLPEPKQSVDIKVKWSAVQQFLLKKYTEAIASNLDVIEIFDHEIKDFPMDWSKHPSTLSAMVEIVDNTNDPLLYLNSTGGSSAANLLGRFCHSDKELWSYVDTICSKEQEINKSEILAEIVHLPEARTGNILLRPQLRNYEIPFLARSSVKADRQILLEDIYVSVPLGKRIVLRSKSRNKEILPRLTTAHNYSNNALPIYQFLCDLQTQDLQRGMMFHWGILANEYHFLPRVKYKNIILSKAMWNIKKTDFEPVAKSVSEVDILAEMKLFKEKFKLPNKLVLVDGDNELLLNLSNLLCIQVLISLVKKRNDFQLKEFLFESENCLVKRENENFTNQVVFSFYKSELN
jgi:hypothetical protein